MGCGGIPKKEQPLHQETEHQETQQVVQQVTQNGQSETLKQLQRELEMQRQQDLLAKQKLEHEYQLNIFREYLDFQRFEKLQQVFDHCVAGQQKMNLQSVLDHLLLCDESATEDTVIDLFALLNFEECSKFDFDLFVRLLIAMDIMKSLQQNSKYSLFIFADEQLCKQINGQQIAIMLQKYQIVCDISADSIQQLIENRVHNQVVTLRQWPMFADALFPILFNEDTI